MLLFPFTFLVESTLSTQAWSRRESPLFAVKVNTCGEYNCEYNQTLVSHSKRTWSCSLDLWSCCLFNEVFFDS